MTALGRFLPIATLSPDRLVIGESGHRNFDAKPCVYEFASGCLRLAAADRVLEIGDCWYPESRHSTSSLGFKSGMT